MMKININQNLTPHLFYNRLSDIYYKLDEKELKSDHPDFNYIMHICSEEQDLAYMVLTQKLITHESNPELFNKSIKCCLSNKNYLGELLSKKILTIDLNMNLFLDSIDSCLNQDNSFVHISNFFRNEIFEGDLHLYFKDKIKNRLKEAEPYIYYLLNSSDFTYRPLFGEFLKDNYKDPYKLSCYKMKYEKMHECPDIWTYHKIDMSESYKSAFLFLTDHPINHKYPKVYKILLDSCYVSLGKCFTLIHSDVIKKQNNPEYFFKYILKMIKFEKKKYLKIILKENEKDLPIPIYNIMKNRIESC